MRSQQYDILVVDDDAEDRMIMGEAIAELGFLDRIKMYDSVLSFHQDLQELKSLSPLPYLIVLDYNLPGADGAVLLSLLKNDPVLSTIPVVMYSSCLSRTQKEDCLAKGAIKCFEKGFTYEEVKIFVTQLREEAYREHAAV